MIKTCYLYRLFDADDALLYIGISRSALGRLGEHLGEKTWAGEVVRTTIHPFGSRDEAAAAERAAIQSERPRYNIQHNHGAAALAALRGQTTDPRALRAWEQEQERLSNIRHQRVPVRPREVAAFGLRDGTCPVGLVDVVDEDGCWVSLLSFWDGSFGHETTRVEWRDIQSLKKATSHTLAEIKAAPDEFDTFLWGNEPPDFVYYETKPLGSWQTRWCFEHLPPGAKECPCGGTVVLTHEMSGVTMTCGSCYAGKSLRELRDRMSGATR